MCSFFFRIKYLCKKGDFQIIFNESAHSGINEYNINLPIRIRCQTQYKKHKIMMFGTSHYYAVLQLLFCPPEFYIYTNENKTRSRINQKLKYHL